MLDLSNLPAIPTGEIDPLVIARAVGLAKGVKKGLTYDGFLNLVSSSGTQVIEIPTEEEFNANKKDYLLKALSAVAASIPDLDLNELLDLVLKKGTKQPVAIALTIAKALKLPPSYTSMLTMVFT